jgi:uncharacterized membrane protein
MNLWSGIQKAIRSYLLIGLIVFLPFAITIKFLIFVVEYFDGVLAISDGRFLYVLPADLHPDVLLGFHVPGLGVLLTLLVVFLFGILSRNYLGSRLIDLSGNTIARIPLLGVIYKVVKDLTQTYSRRDRQQFSRVVLIEYPRPGIQTLAFVTGESSAAIEGVTGRKMLNLFLPTTPNPTSGFFLMIPADEAREMKMSVEEAFKLIISGGMVSPDA